MGLTFDNIDAPAPAYPNSMFSLKPATLYGDDLPLEELFVGVAMRRYIDPGWTTMEASKDNEPLDGDRCWWIVAKEPGILPKEMLSYVVPGNDPSLPSPPPLLVLTQTDTGIEVQASRLALDGIGATAANPEGDLVVILKVDKVKFSRLAILHQPVSPGRYSASIFVTANSANTEHGEVNAPLMLASFEWSPPGATKDDRNPPIVRLNLPEEMLAYATMASAPTFLRWTKTSRDFDFLHLPKLEKDKVTLRESWTLDRRHVRDLVATLNPTHHHLNFELNGVEGDPVWLSPSTFANPYPVHVHRHLGVITSHFLKELGRPAELFCRTAFARDKTAVLVAPNGSIVRNTDKAYQPRDHVVRVVEFETPAQIICDGSVLTSEKYKVAYFDLVATGFQDDGGKPGSLTFYFRIVGPPAHQRAFTELTINLRRAVDSPEKTPLPKPILLKWTNEPNLFAVGIQLTLAQPGAPTGEAPVALEAHLLRSNGVLEKVPGTIPNMPLIQNPGLFVSVGARAPAGHEFWTDVSLLHSSNIKQHATLDFDWLFSPGSEAEPAVSVSSAGPNTMTEAQARVIAVSPPIPIVRH
jgi:hypothetical protein